MSVEPSQMIQDTKMLLERCPLLALTALSLLMPRAFAQDIDCRLERIESAKRIIAQNDEFKLRANKFHVDSQKNINEANTLKGEAEKLQQKAIIHASTAKMAPAQLKAANAQFANDVKQFQIHAFQYQDHLKRLQQSIGECHANGEQYMLNVKDFELHAGAYHVGNALRPPHICGALDLSMADSSRLANQMMIDQNRVAGAEAALRKVENQLQGSINAAPALMTKAVQESRRQEVEQAVASEFSRLSEEFKTLEIERQALVNQGVKPTITTNTVTAKIKQH